MGKSKQDRSANDQRSDVKNRNNEEYKKAEENTAKQKSESAKNPKK